VLKNDPMTSIASKEAKNGTSSEVRWTDDMIRWDDVKPKDENDSDEEEPMFDPFKDPDPVKMFNYRFPLSMNEESSCVEEGNDEIKANCSNFVDVELRGYKTDADEVWQSTGVTLWRAATYLCDYMVKHVDIFENKRILEVRCISDACEVSRDGYLVMCQDEQGMNASKFYCCLQQTNLPKNSPSFF